MQRRDEKILQFQVVFKPYDKISQFDKLRHILKTNASLWSDSTAEAETMKQGSAVYTFREDPEQERILVTITPK